MTTTFHKINTDWNAEPNAPCPNIEWCGADLKLTFYMNAFQFPDYDEGDKGEVTFQDCSRYRLGALNDEGWYQGQSRFKGVYHQWGEFYEVHGDLCLDPLLDDWQVRAPDTADRMHYLLYFRDNDFECDARSWTINIVKAK